MYKAYALLVTAAFLASPGFAQDWGDRDHETMISERFPVDEGGTLQVEVSDADVEVVTGTSDQVLVEVILTAREIDDDARAYFERQRLSVTNNGETVRVISRPRRPLVRLSWRDTRNRPSIYVRVSAPRTFNADIQTDDGDIRIEQVDGNVRLRTSDGDISTGSLRGIDLALRTSDGDIRVDQLDGEAIDVGTADGDLMLGMLAADRITVRTSDGNIVVAGVDGETFHGQTSDGDIKIDRLVAASSTLRTSDGDITITVPANHGADLRLRGDEVRVGSGLEFEGRIDKDRQSATGVVSGGGSLIDARSSDGDVVVRGIDY